MIKPKFVILLISTLLIHAQVVADDGYEEARRLSESGEILPLGTLLSTIQKQQPGRVLEVEFEEVRGRYLYEIEFLDERGAVWEFKVDAVTGEILESELED